MCIFGVRLIVYPFRNFPPFARFYDLGLQIHYVIISSSLKSPLPLTQLTVLQLVLYNSHVNNLLNIFSYFRFVQKIRASSRIVSYSNCVRRMPAITMQSILYHHLLSLPPFLRYNSHFLEKFVGLQSNRPNSLKLIT